MSKYRNSLNFGGGVTLKAFNKEGFTLAEVLITLGIIGVVAAMTIPNLMANIQGARVRTQFKKAISTLNQAVRMNVANYDWDFSAINTDWSDCGATDNPESQITICALFNANLSGETYLDNWNSRSFDYSVTGTQTSINAFIRYQLQDGIIITVNDLFNGGCTKKDNVVTGQYSCTGFIDVNGKQLPNKQVQCKNPSDTKWIFESDYKDCIVDNKGMGDVFDVVFYDSTVEPATNAGRYVLNTSK